MEMFDEITETKVAPDGTAEVRLASPSAEKMETACKALVIAERRFRKLDENPACVTDGRLNCTWWDALEDLYCCDKALWELFVGPDRSALSNKRYSEFRSRLVAGKRLRADA
jgi:hypothetical protein